MNMNNRLRLLTLSIAAIVAGAMAQPTITSFTPSSGPIGTTVTITGTNFSTTAANNIVFFGATKATVTGASTTQLTVTVPAGATYQPICVTVGGLTGYSSQPFVVTFPTVASITSGSLASKVDFTTGLSAVGVAIGDIDGDGKPDLVIVNYSSKTVSVFTNTSSSGSITSGSFAAKVDFVTGAGPGYVAIGDIDGDGKPDLVIINYDGATVSVLRNTSSSGSVTFAAKVDFTIGTHPGDVAIGDIDGDGKPDLATANDDGTVSVLRNTSSPGSITFAAKFDFDLGIETHPSAVAIGDIDGDGKPDLVVVNFGSYTVSVFRNTSTSGSITFAAKVDFGTGAYPTAVAIGDIDGDGKPDLVVVNWGSNTVSVLRNTSLSGSIAFAAKVDFATGANPQGVAIGDIDGDGKPDLVTTNYEGATVSVLRNTSSSGSITLGSFAAKVDFTTGTHPRKVAIGDIDGDGKPDLVVANEGSNTVSVLHNIPFSLVQSIVSVSPSTVTAGSTAIITLHVKDGAGNNLTTGGLTVAFSLTGVGTSNGTIGSVTDNQDGTYSATFTGTTAGTAKTISATIGGSAVTSALPTITVTATGPPTITSFTPTSGPIGTAVTITGTNFSTAAANNIVYFGATKATVTGASTTQLTVTVLAGATYQPISVTVGGLSGYSSQPFIVTFPTVPSITSGSFASKVDFTAGTNPFGVAIGDLDGDGKPDLVVVNKNSNTVSVFRNTNTSGSVTSGSFAAKVDFATGTGPVGVAIGDIDGDGKADLVVVNTGNSTISVLRNTSSSGLISFAPIVDFTTGGYPYNVAIGDIDGDGKPDLVVVNTGSNTISVLRNTSSSGSISFAAKVDFTTGTDPYSVAIGDIDGDGKPDLAVTNGDNNTVSVFRNTSSPGSISFAAKVDFATGVSPMAVGIGDIDGDGKPDLVITNQNSSTVSVLRNRSSSGSIAFDAKVDFATGPTPWGVAIGDIDGDGKPDLVVAGFGSNTVSVFRNTSSSGSITPGTFAGNADLTTGTNPIGVAIGDIDGDGKPDLVVTNNTSNTVSVIQNITQSRPLVTSFTPALGPVGTTVIITGANFSSTAARNIVFFGATKATVTGASTTQLTVAVPAGATYQPITVTVGGLTGYSSEPFIVTFPTVASITSESFASKVDFTAGGSIETVAIGDIDDDGKPDLVVGNPGNTVSVFWNTSSPGSITSGSFAAKVDFTTGAYPQGVTFGDIDGDGKPDLVVLNAGSNTVSVLRNTSSPGSITSGSFAAKVDFTTGANPYAIAIGDIDGDGKPDLAVISGTSSGTVSVFRNTSSPGSISFAEKVDLTTGKYPEGVAVADLDGDGKPDLVVGNYGSNIVSVFRNTSTSGSITSGSFAARVDFTTGAWPYGVAIGDIDGDGKPDLVVANAGSSTLSVFRNTSSPGSVMFAARADLTTGVQPYCVAIGDIDGDGKPDLVAGNTLSGTVSVFRNTSSSGSITSGSFAAKVDFTTGADPWGVAIGDVDGDGKPDLVVANRDGNTVSVLQNIVSAPASLSQSVVTVSTSTVVLGSTAIITLQAKDGVGNNLTTGGLTVAFSLTGAGTSNGTIGSVTDNGNGTYTATFTGTTAGTAKTVSATINGSAVTSTLPTITVTAAPPAITSFTPSSGPIGTAVTITGTNFSPAAANNIVFFGATKATVTGASTTQLTVSVPAGATYQPISVTVGGLTAYSPRPFVVTFPTVASITSGSLASGVDFATGTWPIGVAIGDIDGDGKPDLVVANSYSATVSVFRNTSSSGSITSGSFAAKVNFATGAGPYNVAIGDIDGDGKLDLVVTNNSDNTVSLFRNTSSSGSITSGSFAAKVDFAAGGSPYYVAIGDIDGDGKPDLVVANYSSNTISVFRNTSSSGSITSGSFAAKVDFAAGGSPIGIAIGDIDGDGKPDLVVTNCSSNTVSVLRNLSAPGSITFVANVDFATGGAPHGVAIGDFDGDGKPDLVVTNDDRTVSVLRNTSSSGSISFDGKVDFTSGWTPYAVAIGDIDGDGKPDVVVTNVGTFGNTVSVFRNTSSVGSITSGSFAAHVDFTTGMTPYSVAIGDIDGDGKPDLVVTNYSGNTAVSVLRNIVAGATTPPTITSFTPLSGPIGTVVTITGTNFSTTAANNIVFFGATKATVTGASTTQLTVTVPAGATYQLITVTVGGLTGYSSQPFIVTFPTVASITSGSLASKVDFATGANPYGVAIGDIDGDGKTDLVVPNYDNNTVSVLRNTSSSGSITASSFAARVDFATGTWPDGVAIGDIDGDGKPDLVVTSSNSNTVSVFRNTSSPGSISFAAKVDFTTGASPFHVAIGDIDGDGKPDLAITNTSVNTVSVLRNMSSPGSVSFAAKVDFATGSGPYDVAFGDIDGDGKPDLVIVTQVSATVSALRNTSSSGSISFAVNVDIATGTWPCDVAIGDIDGDGKPDLVVPNYDNNTVSVLRNTSSSGTISFAANVDFMTGTNPSGIAIGDVDGDGKPDLVVVNCGSTTVSVFRNTGSSASITSGSFAAKVDFATGANPLGVAIGDIDGDGKPDLVVVNDVGKTVSVLQNITQSPSSYSVSGTVHYGKSTGVPISGASVVLTPVPSGTSSTATTNTSGQYSFNAVNVGSYAFSFSKIGGYPAAYVNAADALKAALYSIDPVAYVLTSSQLLAADVNNDGYVNSADALQIMLRYVGTVSSFAGGDWFFSPSSSTVTVTNQDVTIDVVGLAVGDVNGDAQGGGAYFAKSNGTPSVVPEAGPAMRVSMNDVFEVPVRVKAAASLGSMSLGFQYPADAATFVGVRGPEGMVSASNDGVVAVAWFNAEHVMNLKQNDAIVTLRFKPTANVKDFSLTLDPTSQITDNWATVLTGVGIEIPTIDASLPTVFALGQNYPNPFNPSTTIQYDLPVPGHVTLVVYNALGQIVAKLIDEQQNAGSYKVRWDGSGVASGMYFYRLQAGDFSGTKKAILLK